MGLRSLTGHPLHAGLLAGVLLLLPLFVPLLSPVQVFVPLPLLLVALRRGGRAGMIATALALAVVMPVGVGFSFSLVVFLLFAAFPLLAAWLLRGGWKLSQSAAVAFVIGGFLLTTLLFLAIVTDQNLEQWLAGEMNPIKDVLLNSAKAQGADAKMLVDYRRGLEQLILVFSFLFPALLTSGWFMIQVLNLAMARFLGNKWGERLVVDEEFTNFRLPFFLVWPLIGSGLIILVSQGVWRHFSVNLGIFFALPYFFQGLAIVQKALDYYRVTRFVSSAFYVLLFFFSNLSLAIVVLGLFDIWVDFRNRFMSVKEGDKPSER